MSTHNMIIPRLRTLLISLAVLTSSLSSTSSHANQRLIHVQALVGFSMLDVNGHTRALCCGEDPYMTGYGGELGVRLAMRYATYGQITLSGMVGYHSVSEGDEIPSGTTLGQSYVELSKDLVIPFSSAQPQRSDQKSQSGDLYLGPTVFIGQLGHDLGGGDMHWGFGLRSGVLFPVGPVSVGPEFAAQYAMYGSSYYARLLVSW